MKLKLIDSCLNCSTIKVDRPCGMLALLRRQLTNMHGQFRSSVWDPVLIIAQIITMQCIFYTSAGFWLYLTSYITNFDRHISQFFTHSVSLFRNSTPIFILILRKILFLYYYTRIFQTSAIFLFTGWWIIHYEKVKQHKY